ncbi:MAG: fibronectin type III domain-containing protein [Bacteroidia bacterium]|nr:fibronectin type III domain-containing protein [Bacteroidia bacterium]
MNRLKNNLNQIKEKKKYSFSNCISLFGIKGNWWLISFLFCVLFVENIQAQTFTYPVESRLVVNPPFSPYLSDYAAASNKVQAYVRLQDPTKDMLKVKVRLYVDGTFAESSSEIILYKGQQVDLTSVAGKNIISELVTALGTPEVALKEQAYTFSLQVFESTDANVAGKLLSNPNQGFSIVTIFLIEPPMLILPSYDAPVSVQSPQNMLFQWTPRHTNTLLPNGSAIMYHFRLVDMDGSTDENAAMQSTPEISPLSIVNADVMFPYYQLTQADLPLKIGHTYAWQVQLRDVNNAVLSNNVTNGGKNYFKGGTNGYSTVNKFTYNISCPKVSGATISALGPEGIQKINWNDPLLPLISGTQFQITAYELEYKPRSGAATGIYRFELPYPVSFGQNSYSLPFSTNVTQFTSPVITPNTVYDIQIKTICKVDNTPEKVSDILRVGNAQLIPKDCPTDIKPEHIIVSDVVSTTDKKITWEAIPSASYYTLSRKELDNTFTQIQDKIILAEYNLGSTLQVPNGSTYRVDAKCPNASTVLLKTSTGIEFNLDNGYKGVCAVPSPLNFAIKPGVAPKFYTVTWNGGPYYTGGFEFWYAQKGVLPLVKATMADNLKPTLDLNLDDNQEYDAKIVFNCGTGNKPETVPFVFKTPTPMVPDVTPSTGDCFPPTNNVAEIKTVNSDGSFEVNLLWDKVPGATEYTISYTREANSSTAESSWTNVVVSKGLLSVPNTTTLSSLTIIPAIPATSTVVGTPAQSKYVFIVKAKCPDGKYTIASSRSTFDLVIPAPTSKDCIMPTAFAANSVTDKSVNLSWTVGTSNTSFKLYYRNPASPSVIYTQNVNTASPTPTGATINGLKASQSYEVQLEALCGTDKSDKTAFISFTTNPTPPVQSNFACGQPEGPPKYDINTCTNSPTPGRTIHANDFDVIIDIKNASVGYLLLPFANYADTEVELQNVVVDANENMCRGQILVRNITLYPAGKDVANQVKDFANKVNNTLSVVQTGLDQVDKVLTEAEKYFAGGDNVGKVITGEGPAATGGDVTISGTTVTDNTTNTEIGTVLTATNTDATTHDPAKKPMETAFIPDMSKGKVVFTENKTAKYDFDAFQSLFKDKLPLEAKYGSIPNGNEIYRVPSKLILPNKTDIVTANFLPGTGATKYNLIQFVNHPVDATKPSIAYKATWSADKTTATIILAGGPGGDAQEIYAVYDGKYTIGKLLVPSYNLKEFNLTLVPVVTNATDKPDYSAIKTEIETKLNIVYGRIGVKWNVNLATTPTVFVDPIQMGKSGTFSNNYTSTEHTLVQQYISDPNNTVSDLPTDPNAYMFLINQAPQPGSTEGSILGKMPQQEKFGFLYIGTGSNNGLQPTSVIATTTAHELGHGAHMLEHVFNPYLGLGDPEKGGATQNLMDYTGGSELWKFQWDQIHDPGHVWGIFKRDEDALSVGTPCYGNLAGLTTVLDILNMIKSTFFKKCELQVTPTLATFNDINISISSVTIDQIKIEGLVSSAVKNFVLVPINRYKKTANTITLINRDGNDAVRITITDAQLALKLAALESYLFTGTFDVTFEPSTTDLLEKQTTGKYIQYVKVNTLPGSNNFDAIYTKYKQLIDPTNDKQVVSFINSIYGIAKPYEFERYWYNYPDLRNYLGATDPDRFMNYTFTIMEGAYRAFDFAEMADGNPNNFSATTYNNTVSPLTNYSYFGLEFIKEKQTELENGGYIPTNFDVKYNLSLSNEKDLNCARNLYYGNERYLVRWYDYPTLESAMLASKGYSKFSMDQMLKLGTKLHYGTPSQDELVFWTYMYFNNPYDPKPYCGTDNSETYLTNNKSWSLGTLKYTTLKKTQEEYGALGLSPGLTYRAYFRMATVRYNQIRFQDLSRYK